MVADTKDAISNINRGDLLDIWIAFLSVNIIHPPREPFKQPPKSLYVHQSNKSMKPHNQVLPLWNYLHHQTHDNSLGIFFAELIAVSK